MANQIEIMLKETELTGEQREALFAHEQLNQHKQMCAFGLVGMCQDLKMIRDRKYYAVLGYETFGQYTEAEHGITERQAYKYIRVLERLGLENLNLSAKLGVTKLLEIAGLDAEERENLLIEHPIDELETMSVDEVKKLTEENRKLREQLTFFEEQVASQPEASEEGVPPEIEARLREEIADDFAAEYEDKIMAARLEAEKAAKKEAAAELKKLKDNMKAKEHAEAAAVKRAAEAEEKAKQAEELAARATELEAQAAAAQAEKAAMEKQIKLSVDPEFTRFKFLFETWQNATFALTEQFAKLDADKQAKMKTAIKAVTKGMGL